MTERSEISDTTDKLSEKSESSAMEDIVIVDPLSLTETEFPLGFRPRSKMSLGLEIKPRFDFITSDIDADP